MKIAIIAGLAESLINFRGPLVAALRREGHEVTCLAPGENPEVASRLAAMGAGYHPLALDRTGMNPLGDLKALAALTRALSAISPDLVLSYTVKPVVYGSLAATLAGVRERYSIITGLGYAFIGTGFKQRLVRTIVCTLYRAALATNRRVFFQNPDDLGLFRDLGLLRSGDQAVLINGSGVDLSHYTPSPAPSGAPRFLLIARLLKDKGIREYVEAARLLKGRYPEASFRLLGPLDSNPAAIGREEVERWSAEGCIEYLGEARDVRPHLEACTVYVLPSYREGTPRTVLEAMATGRAVVTTDAPGCRETVRHGENGFLVPVRESAGLAAAMEKFIMEPELATVMGHASLRLAREKYDVNRVNAAIMKAMGIGKGDPLSLDPFTAVGELASGKEGSR